MFCQFPSTFHQTQKGMPHFITQVITILVLIGMVSVIIREMFLRRIYLKLVLLLLLVNSLSGFILQLMYISLIVNVRSTLTNFHGLQLLVVLSYLIKFAFFVCTIKVILLNAKFKQAANNHCKRVLEAVKLAQTNKTRVSHPRNVALKAFSKLLIQLLI